MKITFRKRSMDRALQVVRFAAVDGDDKLEGHYKFEYDGSVVRIYSQDGIRLSAEAPLLEAAVEESGEEPKRAFTVPAWRLNQWVAAVSNGDEEMSLDFNGSVVQAKSKRGSGCFGSLDPAQFPEWSQTFAQAKVVVKVSAAKLATILSHSRQFTTELETHYPTVFAVAATPRGVMAVDEGSKLSVIFCQDLTGSSFRIAVKDISTVISFLSSKGLDVVELRESDSRLFLVRDDGAFIGVTRWHHEFPEKRLSDDHINPPNISASSFTFKTADLLSAIKVLSAFAQKNDSNVFVVYSGENVSIRVASGSGGSSYDEQLIPIARQNGMSQLDPDKFKKIRFPKKMLEVIAGLKGHDEMTMNVIFGKNKDGVVIDHVVNGDSFRSILFSQ